jgi:peptidoglycan/LPS O-acetylase OafA/YrhL
MVTVRANSAASSQHRGRDGWFDTLRVVALLRVMIYHTFWWGWLSVLFPSIGVMFALAGTLMAVSLDRSRNGHRKVIGRRLRRMLPPLWVMGAVLVPVMIWRGWDGSTPPRWYTLLPWAFPITNLPDSAWGFHWVTPLWYLRTYMWFVLLSPAILWMLRRWGWRGLIIPMMGLFLITSSLDPAAGRLTRLIPSLGVYGACWMLGMAHHDGRIRTLPWRWVAPVGVVLLAAGLGWGLTHPDPDSGLDLNKIPLAQALYSAGAVLLLFRAHPDFSWLGRHEFVARFVEAVNARAVTIYLWHGAAVVVANVLVGSWWVAKGLEALSVTGQLQHSVLALLRIAVLLLSVAVAVIAFGWVEDVAARRRPRIWPWPRSAAGGPYLTEADAGTLDAVGAAAATSVR